MGKGYTVMKIKDGVACAGIQPEIVLALIVVEPILEAHKQELVVTSALDGKHKRGSAHYTGRAVDLRTWDLVMGEECVKKMQSALGVGYDVVLEHNHIHMEFDPKTGANL